MEGLDVWDFYEWKADVCDFNEWKVQILGLL